MAPALELRKFMLSIALFAENTYSASLMFVLITQELRFEDYNLKRPQYSSPCFRQVTITQLVVPVEPLFQPPHLCWLLHRLDCLAIPLNNLYAKLNKLLVNGIFVLNEHCDLHFLPCDFNLLLAVMFFMLKYLL